MSKIKLLAVRELIKEKQYPAARSVLETIPHHPTAKNWLRKLDSMPAASRQSTVSPSKTDRIRWETALLSLSYDPGTGESTILLDGVNTLEREIMRAKVLSAHGALVDAAYLLGRQGWEVAGVDRDTDDMPYFIMKRQLPS